MLAWKYFFRNKPMVQKNGWDMTCTSVHPLTEGKHCGQHHADYLLELLPMGGAAGIFLLPNDTPEKK